MTQRIETTQSGSLSKGAAVIITLLAVAVFGTMAVCGLVATICATGTHQYGMAGITVIAIGCLSVVLTLICISGDTTPTK